MVASSSAIGSLFAVGGHGGEFLMVADEGNIVFYSSKTMLKLRTQRVSDARIVGINAVVSGHTAGQQHHLHVVDTVGNYFVIDVSTNFIIGSTTLAISTTPKAAGSKPVIGTRKRAVLGGDANLTVQSAQWTIVFDTSDLANEQLTQDGNGELAALTPPDLRIVLLTSDGVYAQYVRHIFNSSSTTPYSSVVKFPGPLSSLVMAVGKENGVVLIGQLHRTWLWLASASSLIAKGKALKQITLPARLMSLAVTPERAKSSFAVGGDRGEIHFYPSANIPIDPTNECLNRLVDSTKPKFKLQFFSDHWHCTPLQAVSFTSDGKELLSAAGERTLISWSVTGSFTRTKVSSSRREGLTEGYLWKSHVESKIDKKSKYKPVRAKKAPSDSQSLSFIASDVATIIIPHVHGRILKTSSPFSEKPPSCFVVGVTGEIAAMDLREQKVTNVADGIRWSLLNDTLETGNKALVQHAEAVEWMGRPAIMVVSPKDSEIRIVDPLTQQSLYTHHVRFNMQASIASPVAPFMDAKDGANLEMSDPLNAYFAQNKAAINDGVLRGTAGGLLATVSDGGRLIFTYEDYTHIGLDSVLRVWRYCPEKKRHVEVQSIHSPHTTSMLQMQTANVKVPKNKQESDSVYENMTLLFTMDRLGVKCWRSVDLPRHENPSAASSDMQRSFLHLGGVGGANGESEADARLWRVVGTNRCPSGRASRFELSDDGTIIMIADEVIKAYEVPTAELAVAFSHGRKNVGFAVSDWESMFTLTPPTSAEKNQTSIISLRFIASSGSLPSVFARFEDGSACCWQADQSAQWGLAWSSASGVHSLLNATSHDGELLLAVVTTGSEKQASLSTVSHDVKQVRVGSSTTGKPTAESTLLATLPQTYGAHVQYVFLPFDSSSTAPSSSDGKGANSSALYGRLVCLDLVGLREVRPSFKSNTSGASTQSKETIQVFDANVTAAASNTRSDKRIDLFFKRLSAQANTAEDDDDDAQTQQQQSSQGEGDVGSPSASTSSSHELLAKVIGSEAYAAPPMGLVLSSLLSLTTATSSK